MRSADRGTRALAAELLAGTENGRLLVRDLRRIRGGLIQLARRNEQPDEGTEKGDDMHTPYGLEMVENCTSCTLRKEGFFCQLSGGLLRSFEASAISPAIRVAPFSSSKVRCRVERSCSAPAK
jgi:hypothetical protein